jgi:hypothetical protein
VSATPQQSIIWAPTDLAYFAGLMDGEGSFCILPRPYRDGFSSPIARLSISSTTPEVLYWVQARFDGHINEHATSKKGTEAPAWQWRMRKKEVLRELLPELIPFLVIKRLHARWMLDFIVNCSKEGGLARNEPVSQTRRALESSYCTLMKELNAKGVDGVKRKEAAKLKILNRWEEV